MLPNNMQKLHESGQPHKLREEYAAFFDQVKVTKAGNSPDPLLQELIVEYLLQYPQLGEILQLRAVENLSWRKIASAPKSFEITHEGARKMVHRCIRHLNKEYLRRSMLNSVA